MPLLNRIAFAAAASVSLAVAMAPAASADDNASARWSRTLTDKVLAPFQLAVNKGDVYVADGATATVSRVRANGTLSTVATGFPGGDVAGVDLNDDGTSLAFTSSKTGASPFEIIASRLTIKTDGQPDVVADLHAYEEANNPDGNVTYGLGPNASQCAKDFIAQVMGPEGVRYKGVVDSHAYSVASLGHGAWAVADAGANAVLKVDSAGQISTLAVLPSQPVTFTKAMAQAVHAPNCMVGETYTFEPVPTDVEVGDNGRLWVTTLPGGPEDPSLGARGSLYSVGPSTGNSTRIATGFSGATNVAVAGDGPAYVDRALRRQDQQGEPLRAT